MPWPKHVSVRVNMPFLKGRISDIPGEQIEMQDEYGKALTSGFSMKVKGITSVQPDPSKAQYHEASVLITKSNSAGARESYTIRVPVKRLVEDLPGVIQEGVGPDASFETNDPWDKLLILVLAASVDPQNAPTYTAPSWMEKDGWYVRGKKVSNVPVEINREFRDAESNAVRYVLRAPRLIGDGWEYSKPVTWNELLSGEYKFSDGRSISVSDPTQAFIAMNAQWDSLAVGQRNSQMLEERNQPAKDMQIRRDRAWGFRDYEALNH